MKTLVPTTPLARRIAAIVHRREDTPWSEKEFDAYKKLYKRGAFNERDISLVERYQAFERKKHKRGQPAFHRRGLLQLLNHWGEEVDHGTEHDELHPIQPPPRKIIPLPLSGGAPELTQSERRDGELFMAQLRERKGKA